MPRKFKLALDARYAQEKGVGKATYALNIIENLAVLADHFDFVFVVDSGKKTSHIAFPRNSKFISTSIGMGGLRNWFTRDLWEQILLPRKLSRIGVNIYHKFDYIAPILPQPFTVIATFYDAMFFTFNSGRNYLSKIRFNYLLQKVAKRVDCIVTISDFSKQELQKRLRVDPIKIKRIWCGVSENYFRPCEPKAESSCLKKLGFDGDFLLYYGGFKKNKNVELLLEALKILLERIDIKVVLVGHMRGNVMDIRNKIKSLDIEDYVKFFGFAQEEELKVLLKNCVAFVFPSAIEGFGLPIIEAMAGGAPVICSNKSSLPEVGGNAVHYFERLEPESLALAILEVLDNTELKERLRREGLLKAKMFSWKKSVEELGALYLQLLERKYPMNDLSN